MSCSGQTSEDLSHQEEGGLTSCPTTFWAETADGLIITAGSTDRSALTAAHTNKNRLQTHKVNSLLIIIAIYYERKSSRRAAGTRRGHGDTRTDTQTVY